MGETECVDKNGLRAEKTAMGNSKHSNATTFRKGAKAGPGRPKKPLVDKLVDRAIKRFAKQRADTFIEACENVLPMAMERVQEGLAKKRDDPQFALSVAEKMGDRVYGRPAQAITGAGGGPLVVSFQEILAAVPEGKREKI